MRSPPNAAVAVPACVRPAIATVAAIAVIFGIAGIAGCATPMAGHLLTERDLMATPSGTPRDQIVARFGRPFWTFSVRQEGLTVLNYRFSHSECVIYQASLRPDGTLRDVAPAFDPLCSGPG